MRSAARSVVRRYTARAVAGRVGRPNTTCIQRPPPSCSETTASGSRSAAWAMNPKIIIVVIIEVPPAEINGS